MCRTEARGANFGHDAGRRKVPTISFGFKSIQKVPSPFSLSNNFGTVPRKRVTYSTDMAMLRHVRVLLFVGPSGHRRSIKKNNGSFWPDGRSFSRGSNVPTYTVLQHMLYDVKVN